MADVLTLHQAAGLLGVHYMTAYRYVRLGILAAHKEGGAWRVAAVDLEGLQARTAADCHGHGHGDVQGRRRAPWAERLESRLSAGDIGGSWSVIEAALAAGTEPAEVYIDIISPAMVGVGNRWERGELDVAFEHRATSIAFRLVGRLGPRFVRRGRTRGAVLLGAPAGEQHSLPGAMLADLVRLDGWDVSDLGANVPDASFVHAAATTPDLVAIGISVVDDNSIAAAARAVFALRSSGAADGVLLVAGGRAMSAARATRAVGADAVALNARTFIGLLERPLVTT